MDIMHCGPVLRVKETFKEVVVSFVNLLISPNDEDPNINQTVKELGVG